MKKNKELKLLLSSMVIVGTVFSIGCLASADEIEEEIKPDMVVAETSDEDEELYPDINVAEISEDDEEVLVCDVEETVAAVADNAKKDGWFHDTATGYWYYYEGGKYIKGWKQIDGSWYCFGSNGIRVSGLYYDESLKDYFIFGIDGRMLTGWQRYDMDWMYFGDTGRALKGWQHIDGKWYFFDELSSPYMHQYFYEYKNDIYFFGEDGSMRTGWVNFDNEWYYFGPTGIGARGWKQFGDKYYYFSEESFVPLMLNNGIYKIGAGVYGFDRNGVMITGWYNTEVIDVNGNEFNNGKWYYFTPTGSAAVGWTKIDNKWYYFDRKSDTDPAAYQGLRKINNVWYYFDEDNCSMITDSWLNMSELRGSIYTGSKREYWMYFDGSGAAATGWKKFNNKYYYFITVDYAPYMFTGYLYLEEGTYYIGDNGVLCTGWFKQGRDYCYAESNGLVVQDGWKEIGGKTYYFRWGYMATGIMLIDGIYYDFGTNGVCRNAPVG